MSGFSLGKSPDDGVSMLDSVDMEEEGEGVATGRETSQLETGYKPVNSSTPMLGTKGKSTKDSQKEGTTDSGQKDDDVTTPIPNFAAVPKADVPNSEVETNVSEQNQIRGVESQTHERPQSLVEKPGPHLFAFRMKIKSIGLVSTTGLPYNCQIRFNKWNLSLNKWEPATLPIRPSKQLTELQNRPIEGVSNTISFSAPPKKVDNVLLKNKIDVLLWNESNVGRPNELIGRAEFSLHQVGSLTNFYSVTSFLLQQGTLCWIWIPVLLYAPLFSEKVN